MFSVVNIASLDIGGSTPVFQKHRCVVGGTVLTNGVGALPPTLLFVHRPCNLSNLTVIYLSPIYTTHTVGQVAKEYIEVYIASRCHSYSFIHETSNVRQFEPLSRFMESYGTWNKLSTGCINASSVNVFKNRSDKCLTWAGHT